MSTREWKRKLTRWLCLLSFTLLIPLTPGFSQSIVDALNHLQKSDGTIQGRLYGGTIDAKIFHGESDSYYLDVYDNNRTNLGHVTCGARTAPQSKADFDKCITGPGVVDKLVQILFPSSLSAGRDASQEHAGLFLLTTVLGMAGPTKRETTRRSNIGGLVEHEWFSGSGISGDAWQGLYQMHRAPVSIHGRYTRQDDSVHTNSGTVSADFHPSFVLNSDLQWRVGFDARSGFVYSRSSPRDAGTGIEPLSLGSVDYGGGIWTSVIKEISRVRLGGATLFQGSQSYFPSIAGSDFEFVIKAMGKRPVAYDVAYGGLVGVLTSERGSVNAKFLETRDAVNNTDWVRPPLRIGMVGYSYELGGVTPIAFGYKISTGNGITSHSIFFQGNFR